MKIKPESLLFDNEDFLYKKIFVTGLDEALISHVTEFLIKKFKSKNYFIERSGIINNNLSGDLFSDKKVLFLIKNYSSKKESLDFDDSSENIVLISLPNNKKTGSLKSEFIRSKDAVLIDCYSLNRSAKDSVIRNFITIQNIKVTKEVFWYLLDNFSNEYVLLIKQLESLSLFDNEINTINDIENAVFVENKIEINKMFFHIFKNNNTLINIFNKNIYSESDFYIFVNSLKLYLNIISGSTNRQDALTKFPRYLFNEKDVFVKIYNNLNKEKLNKIYKNIFKLERLVRKNTNMYFIVGLRFLLNTKKIIIS